MISPESDISGLKELSKYIHILHMPQSPESKTIHKNKNSGQQCIVRVTDYRCYKGRIYFLKILKEL